MPVQPLWRKSSRSGGGNDCVELADLGDSVGIRDSKNPDGGHLSVPRPVLSAFLAAVRTGRHDR